MASAQQPALPDRKQLLQAVEAEQKMVKAQSYAQSLREKAAKLANSQERTKMIQEAYEKELEAHGHSKYARRLQSGTWQGLAAGGGIGLGSGVGLGATVGTVTGTLVGGLVSVPTTALGALIGTTVGAIHGPWIKLGGKEKKFEDASPEEVADAIEQEHAKKTQAFQEQTGMTAEGGGDLPLPHSEPIGPPSRRKPRKLEIRSVAAEAVSPTTPELEASERPKRPRKLDTRSSSRDQSTIEGIEHSVPGKG